MQKALKTLLFLTSLILCSCSKKYREQPNIIIIMADDIGFSDIGSYGGEVKTPHLDFLAHEGLRFQTFYNMAKCNPTRSSLLTGLYNGGDGAVHLAHLTKKAGYQNIMSGKEHFDSWVPEYCHAEYVFDHSFTFWATTEYFQPPSGKFERPFSLEGKELKASEIKFKEAPMYKTDFITDYASDWLDEAFEKEDPFFLYLPYHAAHYPLQARPEDIAKYRGTYIEGWDKLRQERFERSIQSGVLPKNALLSLAEGSLNKQRGPLIPEYTDYYPWEELSETKKDSLDLEMAVYSAIIDRMDQNIGRILAKLKVNNKLENTLIMFLVDNGACPFYSNKIKNIQPGPANSYWSQRSSWSNLANTPFRQYKQCGHEGGSHTPFIAYWPGVIKPNTITAQPGHVVDIAPTFIDILNISYPDSIAGFPSLALAGKSLLPIFKGDERTEPDYFISGLDKFRMYRSGDYKIVRLNGGSWELYNIIEDPTEMNNLATVVPEILKKLASEYAKKEGGLNKVSFATNKN